MQTLTAHCIIKNEERFVGYAIKSVINFVDCVIVFDTGSTDDTVSIIREIQKEYPEKIIFEEKGECDKKRHTELRQEMLTRTTTDWFMILDGDEVWTERGIKEALEEINKEVAECLIVPFYLCVGDVFHAHKKPGSFSVLDKTGLFALRFLKKTKGIHWEGDYNEDVLKTENGDIFFESGSARFLNEKYWHLTHLARSSKDENDYSSGGSRKEKQRLFYHFVGKRIEEEVPEVFKGNKNIERISSSKSLFNLVRFFLKKVIITKQFLKYFVVGTTGTALDLLTLFVLKDIFGISAVLSVVLNQIIMLFYIYFLNKYWTFKSKNGMRGEMTKFYALAGINYVIAVGWMFIGHDIFTLPYIIVRLSNIVCSTLWNFTLYKIWVFKK